MNWSSKASRHRFLLLIWAILLSLAISGYIFNKKYYSDIKLIDIDWSAIQQTGWANFSEKSYESTCIDIYKKLRFPAKNLFFNPALKQPPAHMLDEFTQHGEMPIKKWWYFNDVYADSEGAEKKNMRVFGKKEIEGLLNMVRKNKPLGYYDKVLNELMHSMKPALVNKTLCVVGTQKPWIEAIGLDVGCSKIVTLDYTRNIYSYPNMEWLHVNDYLDDALESKHLEKFDSIVSFSSLEHTGLGRYGDPINPNGDIEAVRQIHCMLKPGGLFFLGLPVNDDGSSHIEYNAHRVYGTARLELLFKGWRPLVAKKDTMGGHTIFVLQKIK